MVQPRHQAVVLTIEDTERIRVDSGVVAFKTASVAATDAGNTQAVAAVTGKRIRVLSVLVTNAGAAANKVKFQSSTTDITGTHEIAADGGGFMAAPPRGYFCQTVAGEALNINLGDGGDVAATIGYVEV